MRKVLSAATIFLLVFIAVACGKYDHLWTKTYNFPSEEWRGEERLGFFPDTLSLERGKADRMVISVRYGEDATLEGLPIVMETESPDDGYYRCDTIELKLLPIEKRTANRARMGIFETCDTFKLEHFAKPGWNLTLHPALGENLITGLYSLTLELYEK